MTQRAEFLDQFSFERKEFLDLDFNSIEWSHKEEKMENGKLFKEFTCNEKFNYGNQQFEIIGEKTQGYLNGKLDMERIVYRIGAGESNIVLRINYAVQNNNTEVRTFIERFDEKKLLPCGFGMKLYEKMLDSFGGDAKQRKNDLIHIEERKLATAKREKKMTRKEWDSKFGRLLRERGYREAEEGIFEFVYKPV